MTSARDILRKHRRRPAEGGGGDFWNFAKEMKAKGDKRFRPYRFGDDKTVVAIRVIHWPGPVDCTQDDTCRPCQDSASAFSMGDKASKKKGREMAAKQRWTFAGCFEDEPGSFVMWETSNSQGEKLFEGFAAAGGKTSAFPVAVREEGMDPAEYAAIVEEEEAFWDAVDRGIPLVCGPNGLSFVITFDPDAQPKDMYKIQLDPFNKTELILPEDEDVPDVREIRKKK